jgi:hypothetical protein
MHRQRTRTGVLVYSPAFVSFGHQFDAPFSQTQIFSKKTENIRSANNFKLQINFRSPPAVQMASAGAGTGAVDDSGWTQVRSHRRTKKEHEAHKAKRGALEAQAAREEAKKREQKAEKLERRRQDRLWRAEFEAKHAIEEAKREAKFPSDIEKRKALAKMQFEQDPDGFYTRLWQHIAVAFSQLQDELMPLRQPDELENSVPVKATMCFNCKQMINNTAHCTHCGDRNSQWVPPDSTVPFRLDINAFLQNFKPRQLLSISEEGRVHIRFRVILAAIFGRGVYDYDIYKVSFGRVICSRYSSIADQKWTFRDLSQPIDLYDKRQYNCDDVSRVTVAGEGHQCLFYSPCQLPMLIGLCAKYFSRFSHTMGFSARQSITTPTITNDCRCLIVQTLQQSRWPAVLITLLLQYFCLG